MKKEGKKKKTNNEIEENNFFLEFSIDPKFLKVVESMLSMS